MMSLTSVTGQTFPLWLVVSQQVPKATGKPARVSPGTGLPGPGHRAQPPPKGLSLAENPCL